jgi:hypothetical protein
MVQVEVNDYYGSLNQRHQADHSYEGKQQHAYFGGCKPDELTHSLIRDAVSAIRARFRRASRSAPGRSLTAFDFN